MIEKPGPTADVVADVIADVIVVAAGASTRMGGVDKLFASIGDRPLLAWTVAACAAARCVERIVVVGAPDRVSALRSAPWMPPKVVAVVAGGRLRQDSVAAGFEELERLPAPDDRPVLIHDGGRPLVSTALIERIASAVATHGAAIPVVPLPETVKRIAGEVVEGTVDRAPLAAAQTPQGVRRGLLRQAFDAFPAGGCETWTDDAALLEACRIPVHAIAGEPGNIKVTVVEDLERVESALLGLPDRSAPPSAAPDRTAPHSAADARRAPSDRTDRGLERVGFGSDRHPFGPGEPLMLGGIAFPGAPRLHGHSDGDVVLHAVADALLGAAALGDLGRLHPAGPETPAGISSGELLGGVVTHLARAGFRPATVDVTIVAARPQLAPQLDRMRAAIADLLGLAVGRISVKGSTGNLDGMEGAGRGISAEVVARVEPLA